MNLYPSYPYQLTIGDIVSVPKWPVRHVGVVVFGGILHNSPNSYERVVSLDEFALGRPFTVQKTAAEQWLVLSRAEKILSAPRRYDGAVQNCDHTVNEVVYGQAKSPQLAGLIVASALISLVAVAYLSE